MYFTWGEPFGIANTTIADMIDIDKAGIKLEHSNQKKGKTPTIMHCKMAGSTIETKRPIFFWQFLEMKITTIVGMNYGREKEQLCFDFIHFSRG